MKFRRLILKWAVLAIVLSRPFCFTPGPAVGKTSTASYVGDKDEAALFELLVSVPTKSQSTDYANLHVWFAAIVNPKKTSLGSTADVQQILWRSSTRLQSDLTKEVLRYGPVSPTDLANLTPILTKKAPATFDPLFVNWTYASDFSVEFVVYSIYFTDSSIGRENSRPRW